ncbi:MAG: hypothetical protein J5771_05025 [Bacteroidales bacterium]|nr:hypothetical protein [Bacteroidales bacterium]
MERVKRHARKSGKSFNSYVEQLLDKETGLKFPKLPKDFKISDEILSMRGCFRDPAPETLRNDPKLAYLWGKYGG